ncbi:MAG: hypothetical protein LBQ66_00265 [Planctomycetaceae bacterium]|nr:hypothetical protein [Planctomycetaceae bacterium]
MGVLVLPIRVPLPLSACADAIHQESLAVGCPPYVCQPVLAFSSNLFGSITHLGGRDTRVPVRLTLRCKIVRYDNDDITHLTTI